MGLFGLGLVGFGLVLLRLSKPRVASKVTFARAGANRIKVNMAFVFADSDVDARASAAKGSRRASRALACKVILIMV